MAGKPSTTSTNAPDVDDNDIAASAAQNEATPSNDPRSEAAPGIRTEADVIADAQAAADRAANSAPPGVTGSPLNPPAIEADEDDPRVVHYLRESDGEVQSVNFGSTEHNILEADGEWEKTTRAKATARDRKRTEL